MAGHMVLFAGTKNPAPATLRQLVRGFMNIELLL